MIYSWCTLCKGREDSCAVPDSHKAQGKVVWRADFLLGGRYGTRIRKTYPIGISKKEAEKFEALTIADYERGKYLPKVGHLSKTLFKDFVKTYLENHVKQYMRGSNVEGYRLTHVLSMFGNRPIHTLSHAEGEAYIKERLKDEVSKTTVNREITSLKSMFKWAVDNEYLSIHPFTNLKKFKEENIRIRWLDEKEIAEVLDACLKAGDPDMRDVLLMALYTGFRKANLERVTAHDILGQRIQAVKTKSGKPYDVPISRELGELLNRLVRLRPSGPLLDFHNFRGRFSKIVKWPDVTLHTFRHTFAAQCLKRGIELDVVCKWMGHYSIEFTRSHYGHLCPKREESLINLLSFSSKTPYNNQEIKNETL